MSREQARATLLIDDDRVRVTRFDFEPKAETGWHIHGSEYVVTPISECVMLLEEPGGQSREVTVAPGAAYRRKKGVEHNVINNSDMAMSFVEIELK